MKNVIKAIIEKGQDGFYSIYIPSIAGLYGAGETEEEAKNALNDAIDMAREHAEEVGAWDDYAPLKNKYTIEYSYDLSGFFKTFDVFDVSALASRIGINSSLMRRYKSGKTRASQSQKTIIAKGIHNLATQLSAVSF
ncbi:MAG: type II toxin-antitoxin system HicB family antitoxin [Bacteroidetes bacterium]|nr:type II toxin-antitoxin system HicB family antitoxin [Bacteroidota bacterium]